MDDKWRDTYDQWKLASPYDDYEDPEDECPNCGGEGYVYSCWTEYACVDPESGCCQCEMRCDWCNPKPAKAPQQKPETEEPF